MLSAAHLTTPGDRATRPVPQVIRATARDVAVARAAIGDVHRRAQVEDHALVAFLNDPACYLLVSRAGDEVVGSLNGYRLHNPGTSQPQLLLYEIDVKDAWRRRGVGTALVDAFLAEARACNASEVWVVANESNHAAMGLYRDCGFVRTHSDDVLLSFRMSLGTFEWNTFRRH